MAQYSSKNNLQQSGAANNADTWNSGWHQIGPADRIVGSVFADQACTVQLQQSGDAINVDLETGATTGISEGYRIAEEAILPYYRLVVKNTGGSATTAFRVYLRTTSAGPR